MDNQQIERINILSEKAYNKYISPDELKEYLHLLDEWEVLEESDSFDQNI
jgi:uncharacterized protein YnzC (UPF0291/DUF896 family)